MALCASRLAVLWKGERIVHEMEIVLRGRLLRWHGDAHMRRGGLLGCAHVDRNLKREKSDSLNSKSGPVARVMNTKEQMPQLIARIRTEKLEKFQMTFKLQVESQAGQGRQTNGNDRC